MKLCKIFQLKLFILILFWYDSADNSLGNFKIEIVYIFEQKLTAFCIEPWQKKVNFHNERTKTAYPCNFKLVEKVDPTV